MQERRSIVFKNKKLNRSQLRWPIHEKELFRVVHCLKAWKYYLGGKKTKVYTENISLKYLISKEQASSKELRLHNVIVLMDVKLIHKLSKDNLVPNSLSKKEEFMIVKLYDTMTLSTIVCCDDFPSSKGIKEA